MTRIGARLRPTEEEKVISTDSGSQTKLLLSIGHKKPKLENISVEEYGIANLRIFYELLTSAKLPTAADIRDYLSYSIKIFELARKYSWESVLKYDDECRILQHTYGLPWSYDHGHLNEVMLIPRWVGQVNNPLTTGSNSRNNTTRTDSHTVPVGSHTPQGLEICRNYNKPRGCQKADCKFSHCCNRKVGSQICCKPHPGHTHDSK